MVVTVGIDVHKQTHCAVAVDEAGRQLGRPVTVRAADAGHRQLLRWARREFAEDTAEFAVEDCRHLTARLERALLDTAATVVRVPPKLMAQTRVSARTRGQSDPIDALAIARAAVREPDLPRAEHTHASRELKLLVDRREDLVEARTEAQNRLRWHLHELDPEFEVPARGLDLAKHLDRAQARLEALPPSLVRRLALEILADIRELTGRINALAKELTWRVGEQAPQLLTIPGCGPLTAAKLVGETANPARFRSEACFAMHAGAAPIPASSGKTPASTGPRRQPATQRRPAPHRRHPDPPRLPRPRLLPAPTRQRRHHHGGSAGPQATPGPRDLQPPPTHRPDRRGTPAAGGLT